MTTGGDSQETAKQTKGHMIINFDPPGQPHWLSKPRRILLRVIRSKASRQLRLVLRDRPRDLRLVKLVPAEAGPERAWLSEAYYLSFANKRKIPKPSMSRPELYHAKRSRSGKKG